MPDTGLTLSRQPSLSTVSTTADAPASIVWRRLADAGLREEVEQGVRNLVGDCRPGRRALALEQRGVSAMEGLFASAVAGLADADPIREERQKQAHRLIGEFGAAERSAVGLHAPMDELADGPLAVLRAADRTPTVAVKLNGGFDDLRADQREDVVGLLADLAAACDVRVVCGRATAAGFRQRYHERLPVSAPCNALPSDGEVTACVETARAALDPDGREVSILRTVATETSETASYHALSADAQVSDSRIRQCIGTLVDLDLLATFDGPAGRMVELLAAGRQYLKALETEIGVQQSITECVSETGQPVTDSRAIPHAHEGRPRPAEEAEAASAENTDRHRLPRHHSVSELSRWHAAGTAAVARDGGVALADRRWGEADDRGEPSWWADMNGGMVTVSSEYANPLQGWVCVARALANERTFRHVLDEAALEDVESRLGELFGEFRYVLRESRCIGYLDETATAAEFIDRLRDAEEHLCELTRRWHHGEFDCSPEEFRGVVTREALGLASTLVHLLDLADVGVTVEWRVPDYRTWNKSDRRTLARSIARGAAIQSTYGEFAAHRQLFEDREDKRERAIVSTVDAADPFGECITSFVVTGPGVGDDEKGADNRGDDLADLIGDEIDRMERHDDAPDFQIHVPIDEQAGGRRTATAAALRQVCAVKNLSITREAVSWFDAFAATPHDAARAAVELGAETKAPGRRLAHHDVRYALSTLDADRILPDMPDTIGAMFKTLLTADPDESLTNAEMEARGGPSARSIRRHADTLEAFGVLERTDAGWRLPETPPAATDDDCRPVDVISDALAELVPKRYADPDDPVGAALFGPPGERLPTLREAAGWIGPWIGMVRALCDEPAPPPDPPTATFGEPPTQASLGGVGRAAG